MSEWWTYRLSDFLMFSPAIHTRLSELVNRAFWPAPLVTLAIGLVILALLWRGGAWRERTIALLLAACWAWVGWAYHARHYAAINSAAIYFAIGFGLQALLLLWLGALRNRLVLTAVGAAVRLAGVALIVFALLLQPLLGLLLGRTGAQVELFGMAPDPTVAATLGVLLLARRVPWLLMVLPLVWCVVSGATLWAMQAPAAWLMPAIGLGALLLAASKRATAAAPRN